MNHWTFVTAAYVLTAVVTVGVSLTSWLAMRAAEKKPISSIAEK